LRTFFLKGNNPEIALSSEYARLVGMFVFYKSMPLIFFRNVGMMQGYGERIFGNGLGLRTG
jgi:hypothetical protein